MPDDIKLTISNIQLVLVFGEKLELMGIVFFHPHHKKAKSFFKLVGEDVKDLVVLIMNNFLDETNSKQLV